MKQTGQKKPTVSHRIFYNPAAKITKRIKKRRIKNKKRGERKREKQQSLKKNLVVKSTTID